MAHSKLILKNPSDGTIKSAPIGFSWTVLFFGFLVPIYRKDWFWAFVMLILEIPTLSFISIIFAFFYNKIYARKLFRKGYTFFSLQGKLNRTTLNHYLKYQNKAFSKAFPPAAE